MVKPKITITFNRHDGSENAKFDNFADAIIYAKALKRKLNNLKNKDVN